jgi:hypothetical protein
MGTMSTIETDSEVEAAPPKYWAFISHSHQDKRRWWFFFRRHWGWVLHRKLETYRIPRKLVGRETRVGKVPERVYPVFLDTEELPTSSDLSNSIRSALADSRTLVVVCSPNAEQSRWVGEEVRTFKTFAEDRRGSVLGLIIGGEPNADYKRQLQQAECFPEGLRYDVDLAGKIVRDRRVEPIAADVRSGGSSLHDATLKLVAGIVGVGYDELKQRDRARGCWKVIRNVVLVTAVLGAAVGIAQSQRSEVASMRELRIKEQNLPFPRMFGNYTERESDELRSRRDLTAELVRMDSARVEAGIALPAETAGLAHDYAMIEAELAWSLGDLDEAEEKLQQAVEHVEREAEIVRLRVEFGVERMDAVLRANARREQTRLALVRLRQVIEDLGARPK